MGVPNGFHGSYSFQRLKKPVICPGCGNKTFNTSRFDHEDGKRFIHVCQSCADDYYISESSSNKGGER